MTDTITVSRDLLRQVLTRLEQNTVVFDGEWGMGLSLAEIEANGELWAEITALRATLEAEPAPVDKWETRAAELLENFNNDHLPEVSGSLGGEVPAPAQEPVAEYVVSTDAKGKTNAICYMRPGAYDLPVGSHMLYAAQPQRCAGKAVKLNPHDIDMLSFSYFGHNTVASMTHVYRAFAQQIEQAVLKANGVEP